ncbi:hypothetical protein P4679_24580 [Priestia megaterium]|uniref:hypothetical protein n=1 Tax=Priestia megaterium TaxID=1404 RepID=UPI002E1A646B|nr:hypothetical protein [Priestia megaterium]
MTINNPITFSNPNIEALFYSSLVSLKSDVPTLISLRDPSCISQFNRMVSNILSLLENKLKLSVEQNVAIRNVSQQLIDINNIPNVSKKAIAVALQTYVDVMYGFSLLVTDFEPENRTKVLQILSSIKSMATLYLSN